MTKALALASFVFALSACEAVLGIEKLEVHEPTGGSAGIGNGGAAGSAGASGGSAGGTSYSSVVIADGPVAYFRLDETTELIAKDSAGTHDGTYVGAVSRGVPGAIIGDSSTAVSFDGGQVEVPDDPALDFVGTQAFSIEAWVKPTIIDSDYRRVFAKRMTDANGGQGQSIFIRDPNGCCYERWRDSANVGLCTPITLNQFTHLVWTYDGQTIHLYVNAAPPLTEQTSLGLVDLPIELRIGTFDQKANPLMGVIDELAFYDKALSAAQVQKHYDVGTGKL